MPDTKILGCDSLLLFRNSGHTELHFEYAYCLMTVRRLMMRNFQYNPPETARMKNERTRFMADTLNAIVTGFGY